MINQVVLIGRTTRDIEVAYTRNNKAYCKFSLAVNRGFKDEQGNQQTDFIRIVVWGKQAENAAKYVKKGSLIGITGRIETGSYDDNGTTRYTTDVVANAVTFLETKKQQNQEAGFNQQAPNGNSQEYVNPYDPHFSNPNYSANYDNPFQTATTMAGKSSVMDVPGIDIKDEDLPF